MDKTKRIEWMYIETYGSIGRNDNFDFECNEMGEEIIVKVIGDGGGLQDERSIEELMFDYLTKDLKDDTE